MTFFTAEELEDLRDEEELDLPDVCDIWDLKPIGTGDGFRNKNSERWPDDYRVVFADEPFRLDSSMNRRTEGQAGGQTRAKGDWTTVFRHHIGLHAKMRVKGKSTDVLNRVFNLVGPLTGSYPVNEAWDAVEIT